MRCSGLVAQDIENPEAVVHAAAGGNGHAQNVFLALVMLALVELETSALLRLTDCPSGEAAGYLSDILLGVAAIHAKGVKLHEFTAVVFVETLPAFLVGPGMNFGSGRLPVIEIEQHRRALRCRDQEIFEFAEHMGANDVTLITGNHYAVRAFVQIHVEVIEPKIGQHFLQLPVAVNGA